MVARNFSRHIPSFIVTATLAAVTCLWYGATILSHPFTFTAGGGLGAVRSRRPLPQRQAGPVPPIGFAPTSTWHSGPQTLKMSPAFWRRQAEQEAMLKKAYVAMRDRRYKEAEAFARTLIASDKRDLRGWEYLARALDEQGHTLEARDAYAELLREDPSRCSSRQNDPDVLMRYAALCFHANQFAEGEAAARNAMAELGRTNTDVARKIPSLPPPFLFGLNPPLRQIEATSHLLLGIERMGSEGPQAGMREFDAAIAATDDDAIIAAAYFQKYNCYGGLGTMDPTRADDYRAEAMKAIRQVAVHDRNHGFYRGFVDRSLSLAELQATYGDTPDRTYTRGWEMQWPLSKF